MKKRVIASLVVALPALAVGWGSIDQKLAFVLYREPKLIILSILGWLLLATLAWSWKSDRPWEEIRVALRCPAMLTFAAAYWLLHNHRNLGHGA